MCLAGILDRQIMQSELRPHALQEAGTGLPQSDPHYVPWPLRSSNPQRLAITLFFLSRARFELGELEQGIQDAQKALALFRDIQDEQWEALTKQYLAEMQARLEH